MHLDFGLALQSRIGTSLSRLENVLTAHMSKAKIGTFDELIEITVPAMQSVARRLREIITAVDPDFVEVVRL